MNSLKKRYASKMLTNATGFIINIFLQAIIPRSLGPKSYGDFYFLTNFFSQVIGFLDMGSSEGFYTKISRRQNEPGLVSFYGVFIITASFILFCALCLVIITPYYAMIWPDQDKSYILLAAGLGVVGWFIKVLNQMTDAYGITVSSELIKLAQKFIGLFIITVLFLFNKLNLDNFFYYNYIIQFMLVIALMYILVRDDYINKISIGLDKQFKSYYKEFYVYSHPLFFYSLVGLVTGIFDRWFLQVSSGSVQQGYFGFSYQIGIICFLFTSALTPLLTREFAIAFSNKEISKMAVLFRKFIPLMYSVTAYFSCFIALQAEKVVYLVGGSRYQGSEVVIMIMAFYPIHQTYGQLSGSVFLASDQTKLYRNIGVFFMLIGILMTYFFVAPANKMGFNTGAAGLAAKVVILQLLIVNTQLYYNTKFLNLSFYKFVAHQITVIVFFLGISLTTLFIAGNIEQLENKNLESFLVSGALYSLICIVLLYRFPMIAGLSKEDIEHMVRRITIKKRHKYD